MSSLTLKMVDISDQVKFKPLKNSNQFLSTSKRGLPLDLADPKYLVTTDVPASITFSTGTLILLTKMESNGKIIPIVAPSEH